MFTSICQDWRDIALSTASLWDTIHVPIPADSSDPDILQRERWLNDHVGSWLARAGQLPLSISLVSDWDSKTVSLSILRTCLQFSRQWKRIYLRIPRHCMILLQEVQPEDVPILEELDLGRDLASALDTATIFSLPHLRILHVQYMFLPPTSFQVLYITELSITFPEHPRYRSKWPLFSEVLAILERAIYLRTCTLSTQSSIVPFISPRIELLELRSLRLDMLVEQQIYLEDFFEQLVVPRLQSISLHAYYGRRFNLNSPGARGIPIMPLIGRPNHKPLLHLELSEFPMDREAFSEFLSLVPSLEYLYLKERDHCPVIDDWTIQRLIPVDPDSLFSPTSPSLSSNTASIFEVQLPAVRQIIIENCNFALADVVVAEFIGKRTKPSIKGIAVLEKLDIKFRGAGSGQEKGVGLDSEVLNAAKAILPADDVKSRYSPLEISFRNPYNPSNTQ